MSINFHVTVRMILKSLFQAVWIISPLTLVDFVRLFSGDRLRYLHIFSCSYLRLNNNDGTLA